MSAADYDYPIQPIPFTQVSIQDKFWKPRIETAVKATIPYDFKKCEETGRIDNFSKAGGLMAGAHQGIFYDDSDVFKVVEGAAYALQISPDPKLEAYVDDLIQKFAAAQEDDGYLYTARTIDPANPPQGCGAERWSNLAVSHELYNVGHMYEAAVAYFQATGKREFLDIALSNASLIDEVFGADKLRDVPGHQEIELALMRLHRVTGDEKYLRLAKFFGDSWHRESWYNLNNKQFIRRKEAMNKSLPFFLALLLVIVGPVFAQDGGYAGAGTFKDPFVFNSFADTGNGLLVRVTGLERPADEAMCEENLRPEGVECVGVSVDVQCASSRAENCDIIWWDFELAGDQGLIYANAAEDASDALTFDLAPGDEASGSLIAIVNSDDANLTLLFYHFPDIAYTFPRVFATEPSPEPADGIAITATVGMIARVGPSSGLDFTGVFNRGEELIARGRSADGAWLEISFGWVPAELVETEGDIMALPAASGQCGK